MRVIRVSCAFFLQLRHRNVHFRWPGTVHRGLPQLPSTGYHSCGAESHHQDSPDSIDYVPYLVSHVRYWFLNILGAFSLSDLFRAAFGPVLAACTAPNAPGTPTTTVHLATPTLAPTSAEQLPPEVVFFLSWTAASSRAEMQPPLLIPTWSIFNSLTFITTHYFDNKTNHCSAGICILQHTNKRVQGRNEWILPGGWFVLETTQFLSRVEYFLCFQ